MAVVLPTHTFSLSFTHPYNPSARILHFPPSTTALFSPAQKGAPCLSARAPNLAQIEPWQPIQESLHAPTFQSCSRSNEAKTSCAPARAASRIFLPNAPSRVVEMLVNPLGGGGKRLILHSLSLALAHCFFHWQLQLHSFQLQSGLFSLARLVCHGVRAAVRQRVKTTALLHQEQSEGTS